MTEGLCVPACNAGFHSGRGLCFDRSSSPCDQSTQEAAAFLSEVCEAGPQNVGNRTILEGCTSMRGWGPNLLVAPREMQLENGTICKRSGEDKL